MAADAERRGAKRRCWSSWSCPVFDLFAFSRRDRLSALTADVVTRLFPEVVFFRDRRVVTRFAAPGGAECHSFLGLHSGGCRIGEPAKLRASNGPDTRLAVIPSAGSRGWTGRLDRGQGI